MKDTAHQYYHSQAILAINTGGKIRIIYTPFRVLTIEAISDMPANCWVYVDEVVGNCQDDLFYMIHGSIYSYRYFQLFINF